MQKASKNSSKSTKKKGPPAKRARENHSNSGNQSNNTTTNQSSNSTVAKQQQMPTPKLKLGGARPLQDSKPLNYPKDHPKRRTPQFLVFSGSRRLQEGQDHPRRPGGNYDHYSNIESHSKYEGPGLNPGDSPDTPQQ
ncbi:hypothetical protein AVEN_149107-1 [Araneus ventricosus]|uniref:Uncharacterized protein n=1 Tax=Araneus ventricosus TaxID=182803 RepID=A0A4Y2W3L5_ARAVE|nr:hypothetical protein AVEN_149107-1 [Araneus ventricosus]